MPLKTGYVSPKLRDATDSCVIPTWKISKARESRVQGCLRDMVRVKDQLLLFWEEFSLLEFVGARIVYMFPRD